MVKSTRIPKIVRFKDSFRKGIQSNFCLRSKFYNLLKEAQIPWKKTPNKKPAINDDLVEEKKKNREKVRRVETRNRCGKPCGINE